MHSLLQPCLHGLYRVFSQRVRDTSLCVHWESAVCRMHRLRRRILSLKWLPWHVGLGVFRVLTVHDGDVRDNKLLIIHESCLRALCSSMQWEHVRNNSMHCYGEPRMYDVQCM